jgi:hypothetical protein
MRNPDPALRRGDPQGLFKYANLSLPPDTDQGASFVNDSNTRGIVTAILKTTQTLQKHWRYYPV